MRCIDSGLSGKYSVQYHLYIVVNFEFLLQHWEEYNFKMRCFDSGLSGNYSVWYHLYIIVDFLLQHWEALFKDEMFCQWVVRQIQYLASSVYNCEFLIAALFKDEVC